MTQVTCAADDRSARGPLSIDLDGKCSRKQTFYDAVSAGVYDAVSGGSARVVASGEPAGAGTGGSSAGAFVCAIRSYAIPA